MPSITMRPISLAFKWILLLITLGFVFLMTLSLGSVSIPYAEVMNILLGQPSSVAAWESIIIEFRLPSALTAVLAGSALSVSGLQMQTLFRNPLAGPFVLGVNSGASLGVALVILSGVWLGSSWGAYEFWGQMGIVGAAIVGASSILGVVMFVARYVQSNMTLLILGIMLGYASSGMVSVLMYFSEASEIQTYIQWNFGSFRGITWQYLPAFSMVILFGLGLSVLSIKPLNTLLLGEAYAQTLGLSVRWSRMILIGSTAILAGTTTAFCGPIGFLGIAVPHLCRGLFQTADHRVLVPAVTLLGALLALIAECMSQLPGSQLTLPVNAVTALIGAPVVIWIIMSPRSIIRRSKAEV